MAAMAGHDLEDAPASKRFERLGGWIGFPFLRGIQGMTDRRPDRSREGSHILE